MGMYDIISLTNSGDHKFVGVLEDWNINDFSELTEVEKEDMYRLYPRTDTGKGWFGRGCAVEILREYFDGIAKESTSGKKDSAIFTGVQ